VGARSDGMHAIRRVSGSPVVGNGPGQDPGRRAMEVDEVDRRS
jgi:hypothetical protein